MTGSPTSIKIGETLRRLLIEVDEWRARLRLAFERRWDHRARAICEIEIERLESELRALRRQNF